MQSMLPGNLLFHSPDDLAKQQEAFYLEAASLGKPRFSHSKAYVLGICHTFCFIFSIIFGLVCAYFSFASKVTYHEIGSGIWCSIVFFTAGITGLLASRKEKKNNAVACFLVLSLLSLAAAYYLLCKSASNIFVMYRVMKDSNQFFSNEEKIELVVNGFLIMFAYIDIIVSIISVFSCCEEVNAIFTGNLFPNMMHVPGPCFINQAGQMIPMVGATGPSTGGPINPLIMQLNLPGTKETEL